LLVVEVSDSTLRYDREVKTNLYARSNVPEVWVVDLQANRVHVYRSPSNAEYAVVETVEYGRLPLSAFAGLEVDLAALRS
jgi:Uma2 family endonuclease